MSSRFPAVVIAARGDESLPLRARAIALGGKGGVHWFPRSISTYGGDIDGLFWLIFSIVGFWFLLVQATLLFFIIRYRRRDGVRAAYVTGDRLSQLAWVLVPAAIVLVLDLGIDAAGAPI